MSDENVKKAVDKMVQSYIELGKSQYVVAIGEAVLSLAEQGKDLTIESLVAHLREETAKYPALRMVQAKNEFAEKALLEAQLKSQP